MLIGGDLVGCSLAGRRHLDRHDLIGKPSGLGRRGCPPVGFDGERVLLLTADLIYAAQILRRFDHPAGHRVVLAACGHAPTGEAVLEIDAGPAHTPPDLLVEVRRAAHRLGPAGDDDLSTTSGDHAHRVDDRLQAGTAAPVELPSRHARRQSGIERNDAAEGGRFHMREALAEHDIVDDARVDAGALDERDDDLPAELLRRGGLELAAVASDGGAQRFADDDGLGHRFSFDGDMAHSSPRRGHRARGG